METICCCFQQKGQQQKITIEFVKIFTILFINTLQALIRLASLELFF